MLLDRLFSVLRKLDRVAYVQVYRDRFTALDLTSGRSLDEAASEPFSTRRLLVGNFAAAERHFAALLRRLYPGRLSPSPRLIIHPVEGVEGGLSEVEERVLRELAEGAGARSVVIHVGEELTREDIGKMIDGGRRNPSGLTA